MANETKRECNCDIDTYCVLHGVRGMAHDRGEQARAHVANLSGQPSSLSAAVEHLKVAQKYIEEMAVESDGAPWVKFAIISTRIDSALEQFQGVPAEREK